MKKLMIINAMILIIVFPAFSDGTPGLQFTLINNGTSYEVSKGIVTDGEVIIPSVYQGKPVTQIAREGFQYTDITSVAGPVIIIIGDNAFNQCLRLTSVSFPNANSIGRGAFSETRMVSLSFPNVNSIGESAFAASSNLENIDIPLVTSINDYAFVNCAKLERIYVPLATSIGNDAFRSCSSMTELNIPAVVRIGDWAFYDCDNLTSITISYGISSSNFSDKNHSTRFMLFRTYYFEKGKLHNTYLWQNNAWTGPWL